ncbi:MAG TPA: FHA domain-containing protein [Thermoanaerobaculia bacterium]|jgi:pSer/pThr/pTyr-binding forkhead associated (FHA) protein|nr:FHA domain-containing protein [Thermoanaerobaculia bacterium]
MRFLLKLLRRAGPVLTGEIRPDDRPLQIGRATSCDCALADLAVSRRHARIQWQGADLMLEDLGSSGGTYVNGARIDRCILRLGDVVRFGRKTEYQVVSTELTSATRVEID